jgi:hypothetical protein
MTCSAVAHALGRSRAVAVINAAGNRMKLLRGLWNEARCPCCTSRIAMSLFAPRFRFNFDGVWQWTSASAEVPGILYIELVRMFIRSAK